jgi:hypothetical protein
LLLLQNISHHDKFYVVLLYAPLPKVFYFSMVYISLNLLDLISLLCLHHLCRCPLTITFLSFGILFPSIIKLLPFDHIYSIGIDMQHLLDSSIPLSLNSNTPKVFVAYLNISVYMSMTFLSFEIPFYSTIKSSSFSSFYSLVLVCPRPWYLA